MKLRITLATLMLAVPLAASAATPVKAPTKGAERDVAAQLRNFLFGSSVEQAPVRASADARKAPREARSKAIALNGLAPEALDAAPALSRLADRPLAH